MADDEGSRGDRSRSGYVPTSPAMSSSPALELPVVPLHLRGPIEPPMFSVQGGTWCPMLKPRRLFKLSFRLC